MIQTLPAPHAMEYSREHTAGREKTVKAQGILYKIYSNMVEAIRSNSSFEKKWMTIWPPRVPPLI